MEFRILGSWPLSTTAAGSFTYPDQYIRAEAQSSFRLNQFEFRHDPIYLEQRVERLVAGEHIYRCSNPRCHRIFVRPRPIPRGGNPVCKPCNDARLALALARGNLDVPGSQDSGVAALDRALPALSCFSSDFRLTRQRA
ncbi:MAG: hypothetical protein M3301_07725 [Chloroflexota bacterium]|nr:hypothetical protein [Chloroflexota bacterium]